MRRSAFAGLLAAAVSLSAVVPAWAGASQAPFGVPVDPALRTATPGELEGRVKRSCIATQMQLQNTRESRVHRPCGCYAAAVMGGLTPDETDFYRRTGVFSDGTRFKALAALDECRLRRPV